MSGAVTITQAKNRLPDTWAWIPLVDDGSGWEREVAARLADGQDNQAEAAARLRSALSDMITDDTKAAAIWKPRRDTPLLGGGMLVRGMMPEPGAELTRESTRAMLEPDLRTGITVFSRSIDDVDVPAGPALLVREVTAVHQPPDSEHEEIVGDSTKYFIFPPGCTDAMQMVFTTPALELGDELAADAAAIVDTLEVTLGPA